MERTYIIPLRREYQKTATYKRSKKATKAVKEFMVRHMKAADFNSVKLLNELNQEIWKHGIRNPPNKVKVVAKKDDKGVVTVQLFGKPFPEAPKAPEKKGIAAKVAEKMGKKDEHDHKHEEKPAATPEKKAEPKKEAPAPAAPKPAPAKAPAAPAKHNQEQKR